MELDISMVYLNKNFINGYQVEVPDNWLTQGGYVWETVRPNKAIVVKFEGNVNLVDKNGRLEVNHTDYIPVMLCLMIYL